MTLTLNFFVSLSAVRPRFLFRLLSGPYSTTSQPCLGSFDFSCSIAPSSCSDEVGVKDQEWKIWKYLSGSFFPHSLTPGPVSDAFPLRPIRLYSSLEVFFAPSAASQRTTSSTESCGGPLRRPWPHAGIFRFPIN